MEDQKQIGGQMRKTDEIILEDDRDHEISRREADRLEMVRQVAKAIMKDGNAYAEAHHAGLVYPWEAGKGRRHTIDLMALGEFIKEGQAAGVLPAPGNVGEMVNHVCNELKNNWRC